MAAKSKKSTHSHDESHSHESHGKKITSVLSKTDDGTIQITFSIPSTIIEGMKLHVAEEMGEDVTVPGFRKGKAPVEKVLPRLNQRTLIEKTLSHILPGAFADSVTEHKIKPAIYPRFEMVNEEAIDDPTTNGQEDKSDWQVRAITCELPTVELGEYKKLVKDVLAESSIWTPEKGNDEKAAQNKPTREEKEQKILETLLQNIKVIIPQILIEEEVNSRLSSLLSRLEKLGLTLESYLASLNKKPEDLRKEYDIQSKQTIALELILGKIAEAEKTQIKEEDVEKSIVAAAGGDAEVAKKIDTPDQRRIIRAVLMKRAVLDGLLALV